MNSKIKQWLEITLNEKKFFFTTKTKLSNADKLLDSRWSQYWWFINNNMHIILKVNGERKIMNEKKKEKTVRKRKSKEWIKVVSGKKIESENRVELLI